MTAFFYSFLSKYSCCSLALILFMSMINITLCHAESKPSKFIGSLACKNCHKKEYAGFITFAKKSRSFESIERVKKGLQEDEIKQCYFCHTTGYGRTGGFISVEKTPHLKNAGCEVCHGPGELHAKTGSINSIKRHMSMEDCEGCHTSERVNAFRYKPMIHGGAH